MRVAKSSKTSQPAQSVPFRKPIYSTYRTGDGEVRTVPRPGSLDNLALPSLIGTKLVYRDGREVVKGGAA